MKKKHFFLYFQRISRQKGRHTHKKKEEIKKKRKQLMKWNVIGRVPLRSKKNKIKKRKKREKKSETKKKLRAAPF